MYRTLIWSALLMNLFACMSPWADLMMVIKNSLGYSRKTGIWTAVWFGGGMLVHITYCLFWLAVVISQSIVLFNLVKVLGGFYLLWIGRQSFSSSKNTNLSLDKTTKKQDIVRWKALRMWFLTNVLNPKATLFMLALFTLVVDPSMPSRVLITITVGIFVTIVGWFSLVAIFLTVPAIRSRYEKAQHIFGKIFGGLLIALGLKVIVSTGE